MYVVNVLYRLNI